MSKLLISGGLFVIGLSCQAQTNAPTNYNWLQKEFWNRLSYSGSRTLGYQSYSFEGDADAFGTLTNYGTGLQRFTDIGSFTVQGIKLFGFADFKASFTDNRFSDPEQQQYTLNYKRGFWDVSYGTVQASLLPGNRFTHFSRSLMGMVADYKKGKFEAKAISSNARGAARSQTVVGNNTPGPYYLGSGRILGGSIKILLDGVELRQGQDFVADVNVGSITFIGRSLAPTSTFVASFESYDINGSGGGIQGVAVAYDIGKLGRIGLTAQKQKSGNASATGLAEQTFQGYGAAGDEYRLDYKPIPASIIITINGIVRSFSVVDDGISDFFLNSIDHLLIISRIPVPPSQTIIIRYNPELVLSVDGDRQVTGLDWRIPIGKKGSNSFATYSFASGKLAGSTPISGKAQALDIKLVQGKSDLKIGSRKVDPGFRTIEQLGFSRNENATEYSFDYFTKGLTTTAKTANSLISIISGSSTTSNRLVTSDLTFRYSDPKNVGKDILRSQSLTFNDTMVRTADKSRVSSVEFKDNYRFKKLSFGYGTQNLVGRGRVNGTMTGIGVNSYRTNMAYDAGKNWTVVASASRSQVSTDTVNSSGYDYALRANMAQTGPWTGSAEYALSDSGVLASLGGFLNGNSLGFGNNGFGGSGGTGTLSTGQLKARRTGFYVTHQAGDDLTVGVTYANTTSIGSSTSNAKIDLLSLNASWKINSSHNFGLDLSRVKSNFVSVNSATSNSDIIQGFFTGTPGKFWSYNLSYNMLKSSGSQLGQDSTGLSFDVNYRINPRHTLFANAGSAQTRGLFPQNDINFQAGYAYTLSPGIALATKYNFRNLRNLDPGATSGAFRAKGLSIELKFDLANRR